jgi:hypothetical protein
MTRITKLSAPRSPFFFVAVFIGLAVLLVGATPPAPPASGGPGFNTPGNIVIADQFNNRVVEVDPNTHNIVWTFGDGSSVPGPTSIAGTNDAERFGELTLIAGTGAPGGTEPTCPPPNGCPDNRVILVNEGGQIVWQYGQAGVAGSGPNQLNVPVHNVMLPNGHILITDQSNERVIEVDREGEIEWQYGTTGVSGNGPNQLNNPNSAELLPEGDILISDENNNRAIQVNREHEIVAQFTTANGLAYSGVAFSSRLNNQHTLITDSNNARIVEVDRAGNTIFQFLTTSQVGSIASPLPTRAVRLRNGNTLISDQFNNVVIEVDPLGNIVFTQGMIGVTGTGFNQLNAPYDAKVVGDYTGLTPPRRHGDEDDE